MTTAQRVSSHRSEGAKAVLRTSLNGILQRKCSCGGNAGFDGECEDCKKKRLQRKLSVGASNDPLELEADRVPSMEEAGNAVAKSFGRVFGRQVMAVGSVEELVGAS